MEMSLHNKLKRILIYVLCIVMLAGSLSGCGSASAEGNKPAGLTLYYITSDIDSLVTVSSAIDPASYDGQAELLDALTDALSETTDSRMVAPLSEENGFPGS